MPLLQVGYRSGRARPVGPPIVRLHLLVPLVVSLAAIQGANAIDFQTVGSTSTVPAQRRCFTDNVRVSGFLAPRAETYVFGGIDGYRISLVSVQEGDTVAADQEVLRLEPIASLGPNTAGGPISTVGAARPAASPLLLKSPAAGIITSITARVGGLASARAEPLLRITTNSELDLVVDIPSAYASRVRSGSAARILRDDGSELEATVRVPPTEIDARTQFGRARIGVKSSSGMRPGLFGRAFVDTDERCGPAVPRSAILRQNNTTSVLVVRSGRSEVRRVEVGLSSGTHVEIRSGLSEGEDVVANSDGAL